MVGFISFHPTYKFCSVATPVATNALVDDNIHEER